MRKLAPAKLNALLNDNPGILILDVRPLNFKRDVTFIKSALLIPLVQLAQDYRQLPKQTQLVVTDWAMKQSPTAAKFLILRGYDVRGVLKGGIERWKKEGFPVEKRIPREGGSLPCLGEPGVTARAKQQ